MGLAEDSRTALALITQKLESLEERFVEWSAQIQAVVERLEAKVAEDRERLLLLEDWRKGVDERSKSLEDKFDGISNRLWVVVGGIVVLLATAIINLLTRLAHGG